MFSKKPGQTSPVPQARSSGRPMASGTFSVIGADVVIRGNIEASADLHVDGQVFGDIACATLVSGEGSAIEGAVRADSARLAGTVTGTIDARELVILKSAQIDGDVAYETLTIEQGAAVSGRFAPRHAATSALLGSTVNGADSAAGSAPLSLAG